jgi:hypothetical protein
VQMKEDLAGLKHRLIGEILVDLGFMNPSQIEEVLQELRRRRHSYKERDAHGMIT